jgi:predicted nuclease with TOPRIM domain
MSWPTVLDYDGAVQSPHLCFSDPELRAGELTLTPLGLPKVISGAFASVYQMTCGPRQWAVRCFVREFGDYQQRYQAISEHLRRSRLPFMVGFGFLSNGIRIRGVWYPILKMEWVEGDTLPVFIEQNLRKPAVLHSLARQWIEVLVSLRRAGIAHGDLQHGNILVSQGQLKLIDYDGLYVPSLSRFQSHEQGHRNYQHPARSDKDFGPYLDNFPGWVILASLSALAVEPRLWRLLNRGDGRTTEFLLFKREDFDHPNQSRTFQTMVRSQSPEIRALSSYLKSLLSMPLAQIPPVDTSAPPGLSPQPASETGIPQWLENNRQEQAISYLPPLPADSGNVQPIGSIGADWLIDHLGGNLPVIPVWQGVTLLAERVVLLAGASVFFLFAIVGLAAGLPFWSYLLVLSLLVGIQAIFLGIRYTALPSHANWRLARSELSDAKAEVADIQRRMKSLQAEIARLNEPLSEIRTRYHQIPNRYQEAIRRATLRYNRAVSENDRQAKETDDREADKIRSVERHVQRQVRPLIQQKNQLYSQERNELSESLRLLRDQYIRSYLYNRSIVSAHLPGIGEKLKARLQTAGIRSAADVTNWNVRNVHAIGDAKASVLVTWAITIRYQADVSAPNTLPAATQQQIVDKYRAIRHSFESKIDSFQQQGTAEKQAVMDQYVGTRQQLNAARSRLDWDFDEEKQAIGDQFENEKRNLSERYKALQQRIAGVRKTKEQKQQEVSRALFQAKVKVTMKEREAMRYVNLSFMLFLRQVTFFWRG